MKEAIQWWYQKKLRQLKSEAKLIQEQLLQESFAMRRSLELSSSESDELALCRQKYLEQLEIFHSTLKDLSDRLYPSYIDEGLPFALQYTLKKWQEKFPFCQFELNIPSNWQQISQAHDVIVLNILEDLLQIQLSNTSVANSIFIQLKQDITEQKFKNQLEVSFIYQKNDLKTSQKSQEKLKYLQEIFELLTLGTSSILFAKDNCIWSCKW